ncbi:MAG: DUF4476 domain-containing protein [Flavobacteriales bacterium]|nr:DUF4476 domain-containing protein [Flavobacteriales bacterium]
MKKISLIFVLLIGLTGYANNAYKTSSLNLKLWNNHAFTMVVDGQPFGYSNYFDQPLTPGIHQLQVIQTTPAAYGHGGFKKVLYNGTVQIPFHSVVFATVNPYRGLDITVQKKKKKHHHNPGGHYGGTNHSCGTPPGGCGHMDGQYGSPGCNLPQGMAHGSFNQLLNSVSATSFDNSKMTTVQLALQHNWLTTEQVVVLMNEFTFESNKLEFAKLAYHRTVDQQNYYLVNNGFTFSSSVNNLNNYILHQV